MRGTKAHRGGRPEEITQSALGLLRQHKSQRATRARNARQRRRTAAALHKTLRSQNLRVKRVYEPASPEDGERFLVDRLWPRGLKKGQVQLSGWLKVVAPSDGLRQWFHHDLARWPEFCCRYYGELNQQRQALELIRDAARRGPVTLLFGSTDAEHNNAVVLKEYLAASVK